MRRLIQRLATGVILRLQSSSEVARFDGIILADLRSHRSKARHFRDTLLAALRLLKATDPRRYTRVQKHLSWVVNMTLSRHGAAEYRHMTRTCASDILEVSHENDLEFLAGYYASTLVHEATHGMIRCRGILYNKKLRRRIERLCVREEQRFVTRLTLTQPNLADRLYYEFDATQWKWSWTATPLERFKAELRRIFSADKQP